MNQTIINTARPTEAQLNEWKRDEEGNDHAGLLVKIATWAADNAREGNTKTFLESAKQAFEEMREGRDRDGDINNYLYCTNAVSYYLADLIEKEYGKETFEIVWHNR